MRSDSPSSLRPPEPIPTVGARVACDVDRDVRVEGVIVASDGPLCFLSVERRLERRAQGVVSAFVPRSAGCAWDMAVDVRTTAMRRLD